VLLALRGADGQARQAVVVPVPAERELALRTTDWEWQLARTTLERSQGRIGYLRLRAMRGPDMGTFVREFYSHLDRDGVVIDLRGNSGGNIDSWVLTTLMRRAWAHWQHRSPDGAVPFSNMQQAFRGRVVALIDEDTYSDGETLAEGLRRLGLGTLIGRRTAGAGIWLADNNATQDRALLRVGEYGQFIAGGPWLIERSGVAPDIEVDNPPRATHGGADAQLEAAIAHLLAQPPVPRPVPPPYPRPLAR
jgi:tricorn protease